MTTASTKPWYFRPLVIGASLIFFAPVGMVLLWRGTSLSRNVKIVVCVLSGLWFVHLLMPAKATRLAATVVATNTAPALTPTRPSMTVTSAATGPASAVRTASSASEPRPSSDGMTPLARQELITSEPNLLAPEHLAGLPLTSLDRVGDEIMAAQYATNIPGVGPLRLSVFKDGKNPAPSDPTQTTTTVGSHPAVLTDQPTETKRHLTGALSIEWRSGAWNPVVQIDQYQRPASRQAVKAVVERAAKEAAAWTDRFFLGTDLPRANERNGHLTALDAALDQAVVKRSREALNAMTKKLISAGVGTIVGHVGLHGDPNELIITIRPAWLASTQLEREEAAKTLWKLWAEINSPENLDKSRIKLVTVNGTNLGGSGLMGGSSISAE